MSDFLNIYSYCLYGLSSLWLSLKEVLMGDIGAGAGYGASDGLGSGFGVGFMDDQMQEFISSEITQSIHEYTPMFFYTITEGIMVILDDHLGTFLSEMVEMMGARTLTFCEFRECGAPEFLGKKDLIVSRCWLVDVTNIFHSSYFPEGEKVRLTSCLLKDRAQD